MTRAVLLWGQQHEEALLNGSASPGWAELGHACAIGCLAQLEIVVSSATIPGHHNCYVLRAGDTFAFRGTAWPAGGWIVGGVELPATDDAPRGLQIMHGDAIELIARNAANPRIVFAAAPPELRHIAPVAGQPVLRSSAAAAGLTLDWSPGESVFALQRDRACLIGGLPLVDIALPGAQSPIVRVRSEGERWWLDHLDQGPPVEVSGVPLRDASRPLAEGDAVVWPDGPTIVFEHWSR